MTAAAPTSSKRSVPTVELFPFLAVLVCAMGALILVLMILTRQARSQHAREAQAKMARHRVELKATRQSVTRDVQRLKQSQQAAAAQLADARLKLGHVENHFHALQEQLAGLRNAWKDLDDYAKNGAHSRDLQEAELARLQHGNHPDAQGGRRRPQQSPAARTLLRHRALRRALRHAPPADLRRVLRATRSSFSPRESSCRRPISKSRWGPKTRWPRDCGRSASIGPSTAWPVPSRAANPYPLLLVRPDGIKSYYAAREAMAGWGAEFGYELVGENWDLKYPPTDRGLAEILGQQIAIGAVRAAGPPPAARCRRAAEQRASPPAEIPCRARRRHHARRGR